ncbi:MAG TPA: flagellar hook-basal body complex protein [Candidatus Dorea gallistercoris]|uniref:Flagellar hook protein FlgE n=1 Tax=Candidatus Dorea gallistercoris TaxID=2838542 RepID=A0A9D1UE96_9FIRM|nr:flagellar hook-basal body complex protein [Candidatus Dorea gallistercoris]
MIRSMQSAIAGLKSHQTKMDVIGNNIANVNTWGFKSKSANFADAMYQNYITGAAGNATAGNLGGINTSQIGYGANVNSISVNTTTGTQSYTGRAFDCMVNGPAYFIVGPYTPNVDVGNLAGQGISLSRVGIFKMDNNGYLVDDKGNYVYGYVNGTVDGDGNVDVTDDPGTALAPINLTQGIINGGHENITYASMSIGTDGIITVVDEDSIPHVVGKIAVAMVENTEGLEQSGGYTYNIGDNAGVVTVLGANDATGEVLSGYLEMSNVDLATEMSYMITTQRGYQANTRMITVSDEMLEELVNMKR